MTKGTQIIILLSLAALITAALILLVPIQFNKYSTEIEKHNSNIFHTNFFHDLDNDGISERVAVSNITKNNSFDHSIKIYAHSAGIYFKDLIDQWNIDDEIIETDVFFGDYNHNHKKEIYFFSTSNDSLFLHAFEYPNKDSFLLRYAYITHYERTNNSEIEKWDFTLYDALFTDINNDGLDEIILTVMSGFSEQPRKLIAFSIAEKKIIKQSPKIGAFLTFPALVDLNSDNSEEIILLSSPAYGNIDDKTPFRDDTSWLMVFDENLEFHFPPVPFPEYPCKARFSVFPDKKHIAALHIYEGKLDIPPSLSVYSANGKLLHKKLLKASNSWYLFRGYEHSSENIIVLSNHDGEIFFYSPELKIIEKKEGFFRFGYDLWIMDLNNDFREEILVESAVDRNYYLISEDFEFFNFLEIQNITGVPVISVRKNGSENSQLAFDTGPNIFLVSYQNNILYAWRFSIYLVLATVIFFLLFFLFYLIRRSLFTRRIQTVLIENSSGGIAILNANGQVIQTNLPLGMLLKNGTSRKTGVHFTDYFYSYNSIIIFVKQLLETNRDKIKRIQFEQDESRTYEIEGYCLQKQKFFPIGYVMHIEDITGDEQLERFKLWSTTAQKLIHDIKTPLSTLMLSVRTIQDKLAGDPEQAALIIQPDLTMLNEELYRIREMAKSFLQFISFDKPNLERVSLKSIIESTLTRFKNYFIGELKLNIDLDDKYDNILADANQLEIVFVVLIENAIEAMQGKGNIQISSSMAHNLNKNFTPYLDVYIADTGPGIPEEHKKSIFEPFFTTKNEGTGMGLAIVKRIITDHSGEVSLHSREHFATIFRISLQICNNFGESDAKNINN